MNDFVPGKNQTVSSHFSLLSHQSCLKNIPLTDRGQNIQPIGAYLYLDLKTMVIPAGIMKTTDLTLDDLTVLIQQFRV